MKEIKTVDFLKQNINEKIEEEILEGYEFLEKKHSEILTVESFQISKEKLKIFKEKHLEIYSKKSKEILKELPNSLILSSSMFGGKTTLSFLILEELEKQGRKVDYFIAYTVGENYITARSINKKKKAKKFGNEKSYKKFLSELKNTDVVLLDEFSFLPNIQVVEELQSYCIEEKKHLILTGINANYLGVSLPIFKNNSKVLKKSKLIQCYSFVPNISETEPLGSKSIRYVRIKDKWIYDIGLLPLVVSKEYKSIVNYTPAIVEQTPLYVFRNKKNIFNSILNPSKKTLENQNKLFEKLTGK